MRRRRERNRSFPPARHKRYGIGNAGFTLFEIMVAAVILSVGIVGILRAFSMSVDGYGYYCNYLNAKCWMNEKTWEVEDALVRREQSSAISRSGTFLSGRKEIKWEMSIDPLLDTGENAFKVDLTCSWKQGSRDVSVSQSACVGGNLCGKTEKPSR